MCAGQGPHDCAHSSSANKETRMKVQFGPTESSCAERTESVTVKGLWHLTQCSWRAGGCAEQRVWA